MDNFTYQNNTKIIFGKDTELTVGNEIAGKYKKVLLHYGGGSIKRTGLYDKVIKSLNDAGIEFVALGGVKPNPRLSLVNEGIKICKQNDIDFILAVGGGSVIDSAKAISAGVLYDGDVWDFFIGKAEIKAALPVGVILTIAAAGSEASTASVITNENGDYKKGADSQYFQPQFSILNPELTYTLPPYQSAAGMTDIMAHVMERYFTNTKDVGFTDRLCEATMKSVIENAPIVIDNPNDYNSRAQIMWAGTVAHNNLLNTGRQGDWFTHQLEHELSGIYDVAHGAGLAVMFPAWMKYVYKHDIARFCQFAIRVWDVEGNDMSDENIALEGIKRYEQFAKSIGMPITLSELNIYDDRIEEMANKCGAGGNFVSLNIDDIIKIYNLAL